MDRKNVLDLIEKSAGRSAWMRGVKSYAADLADFLFDGVDAGWIPAADLATGSAIERHLLNGAGGWRDYSYGAGQCGEIYDADIAARLCTPSELKITRNGDRRPNKRESWLDVQARALFQAARLVRSAVLISRESDR